MTLLMKLDMEGNIGRSVFNEETDKRYSTLVLMTMKVMKIQRVMLSLYQDKGIKIQSQTADKKEADELLTLIKYVAHQITLTDGTEAYNVIKDNPAAITDVGQIASFANKIIRCKSNIWQSLARVSNR